jgi:hypothetical protein
VEEATAVSKQAERLREVEEEAAAAAQQVWL